MNWTFSLSVYHPHSVGAFAPTEKNQRGKRSSTTAVLASGASSGTRMVRTLDHAQALLERVVTSAPTTACAASAQLA